MASRSGTEAMMIVEHVYERLPSTDKRSLCRHCLLPVDHPIHTEQNADSALVSRAALVSHPLFGSLWLEDAEVQGNSVVGWVPDGWMLGHQMRASMNFPLTCVRKWDPPGEQND